MANKTFISEGYYRDDNGNEYMSIWTYKNINEITPNTNEVNYQEAQNMSCSDKFWAPFNESNVFKKGYMYNVNCLNDFYFS